MAPRSVILLLAILVAVVPFLRALVATPAGAPIAETQIKITGLAATIETLRMHSGRYPTTAEGLAALLTQPGDPALTDKWAGPYLRQPPADAWGRNLIYTAPGVHNPGGYDLSSAGPNGVPGDADDITNW